MDFDYSYSYVDENAQIVKNETLTDSLKDIRYSDILYDINGNVNDLSIFDDDYAYQFTEII